jgi:hypothetical protein
MDPTPEEQAAAYAILFGNYTCGKPPAPPPELLNGGRKSTRTRSHNNRRRRHSQRGGAKLGPHAQDWAGAAEQNMTSTNPTANATLRFYRLIIFVDIIHLLQLDSRAVDLGQCNALSDIICRHLTDEDVLTAYLTAKFGSKCEVVFGMAGAGYAACQSGALPYFTRILTYISSLPGLESVSTFAVTVVDATMDILGLGASFYGIINWGLLLFGFSKMYTNLGAPPTQDIVEERLPRPLAILYRFVLRPLLVSGVVTASQAFSQIPGGIKKLFTAAKYYKEHGAGAALRDACRSITPTLDKLIDSSDTNPRVFIQLGKNFEDIINEFTKNTAVANQLKCRFMTQFANEEGASKLLAALRVTIDPACASSGAAARVVTNPPTFASNAVLSAPGAVAGVDPTSQAVLSAPGYQQLPPPQTTLSQPQQQQQASYQQYQQQPQQPQQPTFLDQYQPNSNSHKDSLRKVRGGIVRPGTGTSSKPDLRLLNELAIKSTGTGINRKSTRDEWGPRGPRGGSSKHKKKHPRPTNKRKLLVKRVRRRSMKNKKKGKW